MAVRRGDRNTCSTRQSNDDRHDGEEDLGLEHAEIVLDRSFYERPRERVTWVDAIATTGRSPTVRS
ncbi:MAG: hypothetical protein QOE16_1538 [Microbacteriaceae bacterium]|nr:hypothetical protein [Microbacteriaceae bacterium]